MGVSVRAIAESGATLRGGVGRRLRRFPRAILEVVTLGASRGNRDEPTREKALSPREYTANVGLSFRNRVAKCRARLRRAVQRGGEEAGFVTLTDKMAHFLAAAVVGKVFATDEVKIKT